MESNQIILFHQEGGVKNPIPEEKYQAYQTWLLLPFKEHNKIVDEINYIFCSNEYLLQINREYLNHDYYTDIITFDNTEKGEPVQSDIFISVECVAENAQEYNISFQDELHRVMIHGILHLCGYKDKTLQQQKTMRQKEDEYLAKASFYIEHI